MPEAEMKKDKNDMKNFRMFLFVTIGLFLAACGTTYTDNANILEAERLLSKKPDSAYMLLNNINEPEKLPEADYAAWCLHYVHAQYKLYMDIQSDSLIMIAVDYYKESGLNKYSGISYYMLGCVSELLNNFDKAMWAYNMAEKELKNTDETDIKGLVCINMGYLYNQNENFNQANICFRNALNFFRQSGNQRYQTSAYLALSNMSLQLDHPFDTTMYYSNKALSLSEEINDKILYYSILSRQGELLNRTDKKTAIENLLAGFKHCSNLRKKNASFLAYLYSETNKMDSAAYFLKIAKEETGHKETHILNLLAEAAVLENKRDYKEAYLTMERAYMMQDTVFRDKLQQQLYRTDKQFDLSEKEKENAELKIARRNVIIAIAFLIILLLVILLILLRMGIKHRKVQAEATLRQQRTEYELKENILENRKKRDLLLSKLQQRMEMTIRFNKLQKSFREPQKQTEFMELLTSQFVLDKSEWENYTGEANNIFDNKIYALQQKFTELTASDMIVIVLICMGLDISDTCILLNTSKETMYIRRKRIKKRLNIDANEDLEMWIKQTIGCDC